jgi:hypothetical protein
MIQQFDKRNKDIKVWINGELLHRDEAKVLAYSILKQKTLSDILTFL